MKNIFEVVIYLFYKYYNNGGTKIIAYERSLQVIFLLLLINSFSILQLSIGNLWIFDFLLAGKTKILKFAIMAFLLFSVYYLLKYFFPKRNIITIKLQKEKEEKFKGYLLLYIIMTFILMFAAIISSAIN
ncbi:hypothetical protein EO244_12875 [Ancylomarina salipaludis]|uniref:Uncharacterized protein n=1 Tax=Ancylomarina salipaludis TaxID=2501299 RepID=A0A4Q1JJC5_9BACT|nr:hypothetical protein [Ancylomarina salipaludis]RXQ90991.1 hypothetical protein EO244_12875 [Ancylomarina salipaludis]